MKGTEACIVPPPLSRKQENCVAAAQSRAEPLMYSRSVPGEVFLQTDSDMLTSSKFDKFIVIFEWRQKLTCHWPVRSEGKLIHIRAHDLCE